MRGSIFLAGFLLGLLLALGPEAGSAADSRPIVGTDRMAQPAEAAPLEGSRKRFIKAEPSRAPRLSPPAEQAGPILPAITLKGHRESPPSTTRPLKQVPAHGTPPD
jgi:hypothetical protein